jgi:hypothetical protein
MPSIHRKLDWLLPSYLENADAFDQDSDITLAVLYIMLLYNVLFLALCLLLFGYVRMKNPDVYNPKSKRHPARVPPPLPNATLWDWIVPLIRISDEVVIEKGGYDIYFFIRFYKLSFKICAIFSIYGFFVLIPIN